MISTSMAAASNTSSRRGTAPRGVTRDMGAKPQSEDTLSKRPKRTLKLTASQRERKRAIDREAQRSIRLKTKNYIAHLENLVRVMETGGSVTCTGEDLQHSQPTSAEQETRRANVLLSQLREREEELRRLKGVLAGAQQPPGMAINAAEGMAIKQMVPNNPYCQEQQMYPLSVFTGVNQEYFESGASAYSPSSDSSSHIFEMGYQSFDQSSMAGSPTPAYSTMPPCSRPTSAQQSPYNHFVRSLSAPAAKADPPTSDPLSAHPISQECDSFYLHGQEIDRVLAGGHQSFANQPLDEDIIVRAVLYGWREVQEGYLLDKCWQALRNLDQATFRGCGIVERMACLYMMRLKLLHQANINTPGIEPLPTFLEMGSDENPDVLKQIPLLQYLIWPGFRAYLCKDPTRLTNKLAESYKASVKFIWAREISDLYLKDHTTQLFSLSPAFKQQQRDLRSWTMRKDFFLNAPDLIGAIPAYESPSSRNLAPPARQLPSQPAAASTLLPQRGLHQQPVQKTEDVLMSNRPRSGPNNGPSVHHRTLPVLPHTSSNLPKDMPVPQIPVAHEVEAWLGDPEMVPQYWNTHMEYNNYNSMPHHWQQPQPQRGYIS